MSTSESASNIQLIRCLLCRLYQVSHSDLNYMVVAQIWNIMSLCKYHILSLHWVSHFIPAQFPVQAAPCKVNVSTQLKNPVTLTVMNVNWTMTVFHRDPCSPCLKFSQIHHNSSEIFQKLSSFTNNINCIIRQIILHLHIYQMQ